MLHRVSYCVIPLSHSPSWKLHISHRCGNEHCYSCTKLHPVKENIGFLNPLNWWCFSIWGHLPLNFLFKGCHNMVHRAGSNGAFTTEPVSCDYRYYLCFCCVHSLATFPSLPIYSLVIVWGQIIQTTPLHVQLK